MKKKTTAKPAKKKAPAKRPARPDVNQAARSMLDRIIEKTEGRSRPTITRSGSGGG